MSAVVFTHVVTSEAYQADPSIANDGLKIISGHEGVLSNCHGLGVKDKTCGIRIQVGTNPEDFLKLSNNKELFNSIMEKMAPCRIGAPIQQGCFVAIGDPQVALSGTVTEVAYLTLKDNTSENKATLTAILTDFNRLTAGKHNFGWTLQNQDMCAVIAAWDSIEAHEERAKQPDAAEGVKKMGELCNIDGPYYFSLTKYS